MTKEPYKFSRKEYLEKYMEELDRFESMVFELEKIKPINFEAIYIILPQDSKRKKKTILWGFSLAKRCNSKVFVVCKKTELIQEVVDKVSKSLGVPYDFLAGNIEELIDQIKSTSSIVVLPKDTIPGLKEEKEESPIFVV